MWLCEQFRAVSNLHISIHVCSSLISIILKVRLNLVVVVGPINIILSSIISYRMGFFIFTTIGVNTTLISQSIDIVARVSRYCSKTSREIRNSLDFRAKR